MKNQLTILVGVACAIAPAFLDAPDRGRQISATHAADLFGGQQAINAECTYKPWCLHPNYPNGQVSCAQGGPDETPCVNRLDINIATGNRSVCHSPDPAPNHDCTHDGTYVCKQVWGCKVQGSLCLIDSTVMGLVSMPITCRNVPGAG